MEEEDEDLGMEGDERVEYPKKNPRLTLAQSARCSPRVRSKDCSEAKNTSTGSKSRLPSGEVATKKVSWVPSVPQGSISKDDEESLENQLKMIVEESKGGIGEKS
ncbi:hypothetical protein CEXT_651581 [Caerostris extrusa]|uniref:Uncharacterized protein n=1 Tax=Caerostris extrusa TaxID=172846 RepID=A0AAV4XV91_CAEEX|nr:hypothetical protein CEXT_651581 [Caerostris extrusa]